MPENVGEKDKKLFIGGNTNASQKRRNVITYKMAELN